MLRVGAALRAPGVGTSGVQTPKVEIYSYDHQAGKDTLLQPQGGRPASDPIAQQAYDNTVRVLEYYRQTFGRNSYDGAGSTVKVRVHAPDPWTGEMVNANNAFWVNDEKRMWFGDGDGKKFAPLGSAVDVVAHEFTHAVIDQEVALDSWGQGAALNESWADVLASGVDGNWQIAETVYTPGTAGDALRDMQKPKYGHVSELPAGESEEHELANIPNHAAYKAAQQIGAEAMRKIWYQALTSKLQNGASFAGARDATIAAASSLFGATSREAAAVRDAWTGVGVTDRTHRVFFSPRAARAFGGQQAASLVRFE
jgi:bacillolysin